jgi:hypothetical protein
MAAKLTRRTHKIAIQLHLVADSCTICSSRSRQPVRKLLDTPSYIGQSATHVIAGSSVALNEGLQCDYTCVTNCVEGSGRGLF